MNSGKRLAVVLAIGMAMVPRASMAAEQKGAVEAGDKVVGQFVEDIRQQRFDDAKRLFQLSDGEFWRDYVARFKFVKDELGDISIVKLSNDNQKKKEREGQCVLEWGKRPKTQDGEMLMTKTVGIRFCDGSVGMAKGSVFLGRSLTAIPKSGYRLVQLQLLAPTTNRKFKEFCRKYGERFADVLPQKPIVIASTSIGEERNIPLRFVTLGGTDSSVTKTSYHLIRSDPEWSLIWLRHRPRESSDEPKPEIDFRKYMVVAVFQGDGENSGGLTFTTLPEAKDRIVVRFQNHWYQTLGMGVKVTVYGFFLLPQSNKTVVLEEDVNDLMDSDSPPVWKERARFGK